MKLDPPTQRSIDDDSPPELLREYVRATRQTGPDETAIARMSSRLATTGVLPTPASSPTHAPGRKVAYHKLAVVAIVVSAGLVLSWRATRTELTRTSASATDASAASSSAGRSATAQATPRAEPPPVHAADRPKTAAVSVDDLPAASPPIDGASASGTRIATPTGARSSADDGAPQLPTELELVKRAQAALVSSPERALAITREQARAYPSGEFVQEREVIEVEALSRLGRKAEARRRAIAFVQRFPETPYTPRLELAVGGPLDVPSNAPPSAAEDRGRSRATPTP